MSVERSIIVSSPSSSSARDELVARARRLGPPIAERAVVYDRQASFPFENFADFRECGLLAACIPVGHGGSGLRFADYVRVSEEMIISATSSVKLTPLKRRIAPMEV